MHKEAKRQPASTGEQGTKSAFMDGFRRLTGTPNFGIVTRAILGRGALGIFMADQTSNQDPKTPATPATPATPMPDQTSVETSKKSATPSTGVGGNSWQYNEGDQRIPEPPSRTARR
jgi:hypothetical protein